MSTRIAAALGTGVFGTTPAGERVHAYCLRNAHGVQVRFISLGGIITEILAPDRDGRLDDITLGYDTLEDYRTGVPYVGALIGRYANRIANACFRLDGEEHAVSANEGRHHLHGGYRGFDKVLWSVEPVLESGTAGAALHYMSRDGEEGYPGTLRVRVLYLLTDANELHVDYYATTDRPTHVTLTQHSYFNLGGGTAPDILDHELEVFASRFTPIDSTLIPTGELRPVVGSPFDFRAPARIGARIGQADEQLAYAHGYDHNFVLDRPTSDNLVSCARLHEAGSGRVLEVLTTEPGLQLYTGQSLDARRPGSHGRAYGPHAGLTLETQHFPDSPHQPTFPSTLLRPGAAYRSRTVFRFLVR